MLPDSPHGIHPAQLDLKVTFESFVTKSSRHDGSIKSREPAGPGAVECRLQGEINNLFHLKPALSSVDCRGKFTYLFPLKPALLSVDCRGKLIYLFHLTPALLSVDGRGN